MLHRTRTWAFFALILMVVCLSTSIVSAQDAKPEPVGLRPDAPTYAVHGPYWVGTRQMEIPAVNGKPALKLTLWYPALNPKNQKEETVYYPVMKYDPLPDLDPSTYVYAGHALADADPNMAKAPYPLVVFSHGFASSPSYYSYLLEHLASYGLMILAPDHIETSYLSGDQWRDIPPSSIDRPLDIVRVLDYAESLNGNSGAFKGLIDMKQVAVVGQSYGGYTALALAGARYDLKGFNARCAALAKDDPGQAICSPLVPFEKDMAARAGLDPMPEGLWPSWGDSRVKTIVTMAGDSYLFDKAGLAEIKIPVLAIGGTRDDSTPYEWGVRPTYDNISSAQKALVTFENANHYMFLNDCSTAPWWSTDFGVYWFCSDSIWDMNRAHDLINHFTTAFLLDQLKGDKEAAKALVSDAVSFPGIKYESQGF